MAEIGHQPGLHARGADRIAVLEKGKLLELGTHEELLAKAGRYAHLFTLQAQGYR